MRQFSRYHIFCRVVDLGSFTAAANELGYTQSAVSQIVRSLEAELGTALLERRRDGIRLTSDGSQYLPFLRNLSSAEHSLQEKQREMDGLERSTILIDTFTSVSRNILPPLMRSFRSQYPGVRFVLRQGDYESIREDILSGAVDLGFIATGRSSFTEGPDLPAENITSADSPLRDLEVQKLYDDDMVAVLPPDHPLAAQDSVSLQDLAKEDLILLDEGVQSSTVLDGFSQLDLQPSVVYKVYDDYTIMAMIRQRLGVSILFRKVVQGFSEGVAVRELSPKLTRPLYLAWKNRSIMPLAARRFADYILLHAPEWR